MSKFVTQLDPKGISQCYWCKHQVSGKSYCKAFPDGIPRRIMSNVVKHDKPYPGDNGIKFEAEEEA